MSNAIQQLASSKKSTATLIGILLVAFGPKLGLTQEAQDQIVYLVLAYVGAQGLADWGKGSAQISPGRSRSPDRAS